jgi:holin-like protein
MKASAQKFGRIAVQVLALSLLFAGCKWAIARTGLPFPPGLLALLLLLGLLLSRTISESQVAAGADAFLRVLGALFVPAGIGVIRHLDLLRARGLAMVLVLLVSLVLGQLAAGLVATAAAPPGERK